MWELWEFRILSIEAPHGSTMLLTTASRSIVSCFPQIKIKQKIKISHCFWNSQDFCLFPELKGTAQHYPERQNSWQHRSETSLTTLHVMAETWEVSTALPHKSEENPKYDLDSPILRGCFVLKNKVCRKALVTPSRRRVPGFSIAALQ